MSNSDILNKITGKGWFKGIDALSVSKLVELSSVKKYAPGEFVYMMGDTRDNVYYIIDGQVQVSIVGKDGEEFVLTIYESENWFGESALHPDQLMPLELKATKDASILCIPISAIDSVLDNSAAFYHNIVLDMVERAKLLYILIEAVLFMPLDARVATRMLHLLNLFGEQRQEGIVLPLKFSQSDFARMSGGSRQRVNKVFRNWCEAGIVTKKGRNYIVHDLEALKAQSDTKE